MRTVSLSIECRAGGLREGRFWIVVTVVSLLWSVVACSQTVVQGPVVSPPVGRSRPFLMGFTAFSYDVTAEVWWDCGLVDETGVARPACGVRRKHFEKPWSR